jgi:hypothetical protein
MKDLVLSLLLTLPLASSCASVAVGSAPIKGSELRAEYAVSDPIQFTVSSSSSHKLFYWISIDFLGSDGDWHSLYSSLAGLREYSEPVVTVIDPTDKHALFWIPSIDPRFPDQLSRVESKTFRLTLNYFSNPKEIANSSVIGQIRVLDNNR